MTPKVKLIAFEQASILRKFVIFYLLMSVIPICFLFYTYLQISDSGYLQIDKNDFQLALTIVVIGVAIGYLAMRMIITNLIKMMEKNQQVLSNIIGEERIKEITDKSKDEIAVLTKTFSEITNRLEENIHSLEMTKKTLHSVLTKVGEGISSMRNIDSFLDLIVETVTEALMGKTGILMVYDEKNNDLSVKSICGGSKHLLNQRFKIDEVPFGSVIKAKHSMIIPTAESTQGQSSFKEEFNNFPIICSPLLLRGNVMGVMVVSGRKINEGYRDEEMILLRNLALQTAVAVENARLNKNAEETYFETIAALALAVEAKDPYSHGHLERVARYCLQIAQKLNLSPKEIDTIRDAARLHDIGKIGISDQVLTKQGPLNEYEWAVMKKHPEIGESIIRPIQSLRELCDPIRHHHEKLDGTGYPDGLKGDEIHLFTRILSVADIFDALTTDRPYRKAYTSDQAINELRKMKTQIDQKIVEAFALALK